MDYEKIYADISDMLTRRGIPMNNKMEYVAVRIEMYLPDKLEALSRYLRSGAQLKGRRGEMEAYAELVANLESVHVVERIDTKTYSDIDERYTSSDVE